MSHLAVSLYDFTITLAGALELTPEVADALSEAGCGDGSLYSEGPVLYLAFHREAESLGDAVGSAIKDVARAGFSISRVEVDAPEAQEDAGTAV